MAHEPTLRQAQSLHHAGRLDDARALCEGILRTMPGSLDALSLVARIALQQGDFTRALAGYDQVIAGNSGGADDFSNRGAALAALNRRDEALDDFERAIAIRPDHAGAHFSRSIVWLTPDRSRLAGGSRQSG
jgi:tetratricopeptide (TPR) repeat protein